MKNVVLVVQIVISVSLISTILLQVKGGGLGTTFGGGSEQFRKKRGLEKLLHRGTIVLAGLFFISSLINLLI